MFNIIREVGGELKMSILGLLTLIWLMSGLKSISVLEFWCISVLSVRSNQIQSFNNKKCKRGHSNTGKGVLSARRCVTSASYGHAYSTVCVALRNKLQSYIRRSSSDNRRSTESCTNEFKYHISVNQHTNMYRRAWLSANHKSLFCSLPSRQGPGNWQNRARKN